MTILECVSCDKGPCHMKEPKIYDEWPSDCKKGLLDYADWTRVTTAQDFPRIVQPVAMKMEISDHLLSQKIHPAIILTIDQLIDNYIVKGEKK